MAEKPRLTATTPSERGPGRVQSDGELATVSFRRLLRHPPETIWRAITEPEQLRRWFMTEAKIDGRKGGSIELATGPTRVRATGLILEWDPPRLLEYEWNALPSVYMPHGESSVVRWELIPGDEGTTLVLTHRRLTRATAAVFSRGQRVFLDRLAAQLDGIALPDWEQQAVRNERPRAPGGNASGNTPDAPRGS